MRVFKIRYFDKWAKQEKLSDNMLFTAIEEMNQGLIDAKLGDFVCKKRVASASKGKRGGFRTILAFKKEEKAFFIFGFAKNELDNVTKQQLEQLKELARVLMKYSDAELKKALDKREISEVRCHEQKTQ